MDLQVWQALVKCVFLIEIFAYYLLFFNIDLNDFIILFFIE